MKLECLLNKLNIIETNADLSTEIKGIAYDSRKVCDGYAFVAIKGLKSDGHAFAEKAAENGAAVIICEDIIDTGIPFVRVESTRAALALMACAFFDYPADKMKIIGVTGTNGKTTSTHLIKHMLEQELNAKVGMVGTIANMIGNELIHTEYTTPESLELQELFRKMLDAGCTYVVMEVSSHSLYMHRVDGITYDVALYTNLTQDHLDFHGTMENYAAAKKIIFSKCRKACINTDDSYSSFMTEGIACPYLTYGIDSKESDLTASDEELTVKGVSFNASFNGETGHVQLAIPGRFSVYNALGVIAVGLQLGLSLKNCVDALKTAKGVSGRMEFIPTGKDFAVLRDYSHTPDSLKNALETLKPLTKGKLVALFGCGGDRDKLKRPIMGEIASRYADFCLVTSDNPRTEDPYDIINAILPGVQKHKTPYAVIEDRVSAIHWAIDNAHAGDVILLAGKGHEDYQIIGTVKHRMDEYEIVSDYMASISG